MITSVKVSNNRNVPKHYISELKAFKVGTEYNFKPGINIIIGHNGCGKSTLMNLMSDYMLCNNSMYSKLPNTALEHPLIWDDNDNVYDGIKIHSDYNGMVFRYLPKQEMTGESSLQSIDNFSSYLNSVSSSTGEQGIVALNFLFKTIFNRTDYEFPIKDLMNCSKSSNEVWKAKITSLIEYYKKNRVEVKDFEFTVLMDEPDRNLDIDNIINIYDILSFHKPQTQIIAVIHNPSLIYKLSKLDYVNFVEMSEGYLDKVLKFINE